MPPNKSENNCLIKFVQLVAFSKSEYLSK